MRFLYCASNLSNSDSGADALGSKAIENFVLAGHEVEEFVLVGEKADRGGLVRSPLSEGLDVCIADPSHSAAAAIQNFASVISSRIQEEDFDGVLAYGMILNRELADQEPVGSRLWSLLPAAEVDSMLGKDTEGASWLQDIVQKNGMTIVEGVDQRRAMRRAVQTAYHRIVSLVDVDGLNSSEDVIAPCTPLESAVNMWSAKRRVLLYRDSKGEDERGWALATHRMALSMAGEGIHVVILCHNGTSIFKSAGIVRSPYVSVIEPASAPHQVADDRLQPRFAAWHVSVAAQQLNCVAVLCDDVETVDFGSSNGSLRGRLWPVLVFDGLQDFDKQRQSFERLSEWATRLVLIDEESRAVLESRIPSATSKTVLLQGLWSPATGSGSPDVADDDVSSALNAYLDRFAADYVSTPRLKTARRVLMAGHDFKFAGELLDVLARRDDIELRADHWTAQNSQDEQLSHKLLAWADVIFCEFASNNAVWYSWEKKPGQTLIVRFHGYELWSPWIQDVNLAKVDKIVFVSEFYRDKVVGELGWPREKTAVMPNVVDVLDLSRPKHHDARFHLGIAGIVPILKRPDRALDLLERLLESDDRYALHIRGRAPWEYGWMWQNDDVRDAYEAFYERLASNPSLCRRVSFEDFGPDMGRWFQKIGWMLSPSFRETFHLAPVEGMASGAVPVVWQREGAKEIFGSDWVHEDTTAAAQYIERANAEATTFKRLSEAAQGRAMRFDALENGRDWIRLIFQTYGDHSDVPSANILATRFEDVLATTPTASNLARLISVLLRDGNRERIRELTSTHSELTSDLPTDIQWQLGMDKLKTDPSLVPERSQGAAYLVRQNTVLYAIDIERLSEPTTALQRIVRPEIEAEALRLVAVAESPVHRGFDSAVEARCSVDINGVPVVQLPLRNTEKLRVDKFVIAAADALVREARVFRPAALAAHNDFWVALPALIAARRLGIPFLAADCERQSDLADEDLASLIHSEADGVFSSDVSPFSCLNKAIEKCVAATNLAAQRELSSLKVGVIADEFTSRTIAHSFDTVALSRADGYLQVSSLDLDAVFIESAWEGPNDEWRRGVAYYPDLIDDLQRIIKVANARQIPVIFWNKEDPVHFRAFERTARMMDHVFTTDGDMVGKYLENTASATKTASSLPFYAEPAIHNPMPTDRPYLHSVSYAGTYYGDRFKERSLELHRMLDAARVHGLTIYDRQVNVSNSPYRFPPELAGFVREGVPYDEVLKIYKAHPVNINVNSANDSPTMFSRRVVEIAASGAVVLSGRGRGITEQLCGIEASDSDARWAELLDKWMCDERQRLDEAWRQMRTITRSHLAEHALTILMRTAGIPVAAAGLPKYSMVITDVESAHVDMILRQTWPPSEVYADNMEEGELKRLQEAGIRVAGTSRQHESATEWYVSCREIPSDTYFEDLLHATRFGTWDVLASRPYRDEDGIGQPLVEMSRAGIFPELQRRGVDSNGQPTVPLTWIVGN